MKFISALNIKVLRDVERMWGQLFAIALVMTCGLGVFLCMRSTMRSLEASNIPTDLPGCTSSIRCGPCLSSR